MSLTALEQLSVEIEDILVQRNLRGMKDIQQHLPAGYLLRAARMMNAVTGSVLIGTGFPVGETFETDGPVGAICLYNAMEAIGAEPVLVCGAPLSTHLRKKYRVHPLIVGPHASRQKEALAALEHWKPELLISIERPGLSEDGHYYNMRGEVISERAACFDSFFDNAQCETIAIGDGGNEIGMGKIRDAVRSLDIQPAFTSCNELILADVSNWGAIGLVAMLECVANKPLLTLHKPDEILQYLSDHGSVDGVTRRNELTEDGLPMDEGLALLNQLVALTTQYRQSL
ncbi:DUF4392 domain-containing protein [Reinekea marinisedimentorum]|uniref:Uncharacterized protein DUF4392 n=1 Tax=Reinekea marinisedimentorum TaxID=230495 RepID=A0A4R3I5C0_9GAMM|nr:DUF4392 domain-containing protein [Reinekea marinisedimentorum]TCS40462.1 uncharacterized protein DUF4392 [Reinekea marinisedimentorum]